jgi:hypothetical protein
MQSRGSWVGILLLIFMSIFFYKDKIKKKIYTLILLIVFPIITFHLFIEIKNYYFTNAAKETIVSKENQEKLSKNQERLTSNYSTSGRTEIWRNILIIIKEENLIEKNGIKIATLLNCVYPSVILKDEADDNSTVNSYVDENLRNLHYSYETEYDVVSMSDSDNNINNNDDIDHDSEYDDDDDS